VREDRYETGVTDPIEDLMSDLMTLGVARVSPNGVLGDPTTASRPAGEAIFEDWLMDLAQAVERWQ